VRKVLALTLFAFVFAGYMLMYSRAFDIGADEGTVLAVTESIAKYGHAGIDQANNVQYIHPAAIGRDSQRYSKYGLGQSLAALPLYAIGLAVPALGLVDVALLLNPLVGALSAVVLLLAALELGASSRRALILALIYAFCTFAWVYAKNFYGEALEALGFAVACWGMAILLTRRQARGAVLAGAGIGLAMLVRTTAAIAAPVLLFVIWHYVTEARRWRLVLAAAVPIATAAFIVGLYNWVRFGNPLNGGYGNETLTVWPWVGAWGMLFAPGRSLFIYAPVMIVAVPGLWWLRQPQGLRAWLVGTTLAMLLLHGAWWSWWGAWAWGPRYLVAILPVLSLGLLGIGTQRASGLTQTVHDHPVLSPDRAPQSPTQRRTSWHVLLVGALAALGFLMQLPGLLVYRVFFFWDVMKVFPDSKPDEVALYTFRFFMPLTNLQEALRGNLDLAWKPGLGKPLDLVGLLLAVLGLLVGAAGLALACRGVRAGRAVAGLSAPLVLMVTFAALVHYQARDENPFRFLDAAIETHVPPDSLILVGDQDNTTNMQRWNTNRSRRRFVGVARDAVQMPEYTLPVVRRAVNNGQEIWYLQTETEPPAVLTTALAEMHLCPSAFPLGSSLQLVRWALC
jgi:Dolichyl-phosphate-mannose-protein mannosyltransferase